MHRNLIGTFILLIVAEKYYFSSAYRETRNNYCSKIVRETGEIVIPETKKVKETYKAFCWSLTLTCTRHRYKTVKVNKTLTFTKTKRVSDCCPGYEKKNDSCIPMCKLGCGHGQCVEPDICLCDTGWREPLCLNECEPNRFGKGCKDNCTCLNRGECDHETGYCYCPAGYIGDSCELTCPDGTYGEDCKKECKCENEAYCDLVDGTCECTPGYLGDYCEKPCEAGTHGENCEKPCICIPENTHLCDHVDGECKCKPGYQGEYCEKECDDMTYGPQCRKKCNCVNGEYCDHIYGECYCKSGWTGETCSEACPSGTFGDYCIFECDQCLKIGSDCDHITGDCICPPGFYGNLCDKECLPGYWGSNCTNICSCNENEFCEAQNGTCHPPKGNAVGRAAGHFKDGSNYLYIIVGCALMLVICFLMIYICHKTSMYIPFTRLNNLKSRLISSKKHIPENTINNPVYDNPEVVLETEENAKHHIRGSFSSGIKFFKNNTYEATTEIKQSNIQKTENVAEEMKDKKDSDFRKSKILSDLSATFKEMKRCSMRKTDSHSSTNELEGDFQPEVLDDFNTIENIYEKTIEEKENIYDTPNVKDTINSSEMK